MSEVVPNKSSGRLTFADVTLKCGATKGRAFFKAITFSGLGPTDVNYKRNHDIVQQD